MECRLGPPCAIHQLRQMDNYRRAQVFAGWAALAASTPSDAVAEPVAGERGAPHAERIPGGSSTTRLRIHGG